MFNKADEEALLNAVMLGLGPLLAKRVQNHPKYEALIQAAKIEVPQLSGPEAKPLERA